MKKIATYLLLILIINVSFLFSPEQKQKGPNALCPHQYIHLNRYMRFPINCDSYTFIGASIEPSYLWQQNFIRQSRPLYILAGSVSGYLVYSVIYPFHSFIEPYLKNKFSGEYSDKEMRKALIYGCFYVGYIIINTLILLLSFILFEKIIRQMIPMKRDPLVLFVSLFLFVSNQVSKDYFWAAHQQMLNVLSPLLCIYTGMKIFTSSFSLRKIGWITVVTGLAVLLYGNFLLLLPTIICCYIFNTARKSFLIFQIPFLIILFFLPTILWILVLKFSGVTFYSYETAVFRQFVWMYDALKIGVTNFFVQFGKNTWAFVQTLSSIIPGIILLAIVAVNRKLHKFASPLKEKRADRGQPLILFILVEFTIFLLLLGYYADRLTFSLLPILLCFAMYANKIKLTKLMKILLMAVVLTWHMYVMLFNAPHFSEYYFYR